MFQRRTKPASADQSLKEQKTKKEWIPSMLQTSRAFPFSVVCVICASALELLNRHVVKNNGIPESHSAPVFVLRYLPTAIVVALGFVWKSIVGDIKKMTPWSTMSGENWASAPDSLLLNYVNHIEVSSLFLAARKGHYAIFFGISTGFVCGAAVAAANSLTYVDLFAVTSVPIQLQKTSMFEFNGSLLKPNGSLNIPLDHHGAQPYGAVALERLPEGKSVPWTNGAVAFEEFSRTTPWLDSTNHSIRANVNSLSARFECHEFRYTVTPRKVGYGDYFDLEADAQDLSQAGCSLPIFTTINRCRSGTLAWLNATRCSTDPEDLRIFASIVVPTSFVDGEAGECEDFLLRDSDGTHLTRHLMEDVSSTGLLCPPGFATQSALVSANESTGEIIGYDSTSQPQETDVHLSVASLLLFLVNPTDARTVWSVADRVTYDSVTSHISDTVTRYSVDAFFSILLGNDDVRGKSYVNNTEWLQSDVESLASTTLANVFHSFGRTNETRPIDGEVVSVEPKVFVRQLSLRLLQVFAVLVGAVAILQSTLIRPKTALKENPSSLAATALLLAVSGGHVSQAFFTHSISSDENMRQTLSSVKCRIASSTSVPSRLELQGKTTEINSMNPTDASHHPGWRPFAFRTGAKTGVILAFLSVVVTLAVLQTVSLAHSGLCKRDDISLALFQYIPSVVLLLLSYSCSGIDSAARSASSFGSLHAGRSDKRPLLFDIRDRPSIRTPWSIKEAGFAVAASSVVLLLFPFIKIITANLYPTASLMENRTMDVIVDRSLPMDLRSAFNDTSSGPIGESAVQLSIVENAAQFAEWSKTPGLGTSRRDGILENLVFANISGPSQSVDVAKLLGDEINVRIPAIVVDVTCQSLGTHDFAMGPSEWQSDVCTAPIQCSTRHCLEILGEDYEMYAHRQCGAVAETEYTYQGAARTEPGNGSYTIWISSIGSPVPYSTEVSASNSDDVGLGTTNVSISEMVVVSCRRKLIHVEVDTAFSQTARYGLNGTTATLPWRLTKFDRGSITEQSRYPNPPAWYFPYSGILNSNTLWPSMGASSNMFQLLAAYGEYQLHDLQSLMRPDKLSEAAEQMLTAFTTELLTSLRPLVLQNMSALPEHTSTATRLEVREGTLVMHRKRILQDLRSAIIVEALLVAVLCCIIFIFFRFPGSAILPKEPDTIAARFFLLAGSRLVQRLRDEGTVSVREEDAIWRERATLGWWKIQTANGEKWRWGIDIGDDVVRRSWDDPPDGAQVESSMEEISLEDLRLPRGERQDTSYERLAQQDETESAHEQELRRQDEGHSSDFSRQHLLPAISPEQGRNSGPQSDEQDSRLCLQGVPDDADIPGLELPHSSVADALPDISPVSPLSPFPGGFPEDAWHSIHPGT